ncbi:MAG: helix-turn-helix domain-containing protein [Faecalimonas sp.]
MVKKEFDFLYLLAVTPGRVYTYSQIYQIIWKEYPQGDLKNIIYCMVHRLKRKIQQVDRNAADMICKVKEVGYCLKIS